MNPIDIPHSHWAINGWSSQVYDYHNHQCNGDYMSKDLSLVERVRVTLVSGILINLKYLAKYFKYF